VPGGWAVRGSPRPEVGSSGPFVAVEVSVDIFGAPGAAGSARLRVWQGPTGPRQCSHRGAERVLYVPLLGSK